MKRLAVVVSTAVVIIGLLLAPAVAATPATPVDASPQSAGGPSLHLSKGVVMKLAAVRFILASTVLCAAAPAEARPLCKDLKQVIGLHFFDPVNGQRHEGEGLHS